MSSLDLLIWGAHLVCIENRWFFTLKCFQKLLKPIIRSIDRSLASHRLLAIVIFLQRSNHAHCSLVSTKRGETRIRRSKKKAVLKESRPDMAFNLPSRIHFILAGTFDATLVQWSLYMWQTKNPFYSTWKCLDVFWDSFVYVIVAFWP